jgi:hypothetical protein
MAARSIITDAEIVAALENEEYDDLSDSETEDNLLVDDVESDYQDEPVNEEPEHVSSSSSDGEGPHENPSNANPPSTRQHEGSSASSNIITLSQSSIRGKNRHTWSTRKGQTSSRTSVINIVRMARGPTRPVKNITEPLGLFESFLTDEIYGEILKWTNVEIAIRKQTYKTETSTQNNVCKEELKALFGIFILAAALKDNHLTSDELFSTEFCGTRYVSCMSRERFDFLVRCIRFDDRELRIQTIESDPLTPIRKIWDILMVQCRENYIAGTNVTIDEQLLAFRGRSKFKMYIPNKPAKYGLKIEMMCDSGTRYMIDALPYLGKGTNTGGLPLGEYVVKEITRSIHGSNRNVTTDNWFTSIPLAKSLLQQPYKLTIVGTLRANKREIPEAMKNNRTRRIGTSMFCYDGPLTLVSYKPKPSKMVYLVSSCDEEGTVNPTNNKPEIINFYNSTKGGVDTFDQMCSNMSCNRKTNRWPMCMFYGMLNICGINSYIIYCHNVLTSGGKPLSRRSFMKKLHEQLVEPWLKHRLETPTMTRKIKDLIRDVLSTKQVTQDPIDHAPGPSDSRSSLTSGDTTAKKRKTCGVCSYKKRRMTKNSCSNCNIPICGEHNIDFCPTCAKKN